MSNDADADEAPDPMTAEGSGQTDASADKARVAPVTHGMAKRRWISKRVMTFITSTVIAVAAIWVFIDLLENVGAAGTIAIFAVGLLLAGAVLIRGSSLRQQKPDAGNQFDYKLRAAVGVALVAVAILAFTSALLAEQNIPVDPADRERSAAQIRF